MEIFWKWLNLCLGLLLVLFFQLCNGFPVNLEDSVADQHTQLLTGLVAVLLTVCSIVLLAGCLCCQRRNGFKEFRDSPVVASAASNLDHGHVNPIANGEFTIFTPLSASPYNNNVFLANERIITRTSQDFVFENFDVSSWFNESEKDFPRIKLKYIKELGQGWFGKVVEGAAKEVPPNEEAWTPVVVRILEATASRKERVLFLNDAAIYRCGKHANILSLIGRCLDTVPLLLLQEYCSLGDLKHYLRSKRKNVDQLLSTDYPLLWCCQLTSAIKHLHDHGVTHPDVATRNCQLTSDLMLKLGDYGLSEVKYPEDYYQGSPKVPVRWSAPESLNCTLTTIQPMKITTESNIWSLGVTMWEICECGAQPYSSLSNDEVVSQVLGPPNIRLSRPSFPVLYTDYLYRLMQLCWSNVESRPTVFQIDLMLTDLWQVHKNTRSSNLSADDFDKRWETFKPNSIVKTDIVVDNAEVEECTNIAKPLSPSLNNLHGSLDNLLESGEQMELWLDNVTKSEDVSLAKHSNVVLSLDDPLISEISSSDSSSPESLKQKKSKPKSKIDFNLNTKFRDSNIKQSYNFSDSALFSQRTSSESETEDENWRKKVERGAYTEKVRLKSRSVADLMILTTVDYSESESETPLPSLDYRVNYKNVRYAPKNNLENVSLTYGSEGNLLSVHDTFQEELKKLKEERRDSLLFVPDNHSQTSFKNVDNNFPVEDVTLSDSNLNNMNVIDSTSKRLMHELNRVAELQPVNQVFNVFNVTVDKFKPIHVNSCKLNGIINFSSEIEPCEASEQNVKSDTLIEETAEPREESLEINNGDSEQKSDILDPNEQHISQVITETYPKAKDSNKIENHSDSTDINGLTIDVALNSDSACDKFKENSRIETSNEVLSSENVIDFVNPIFVNDNNNSGLKTDLTLTDTASSPTGLYCDGTNTKQVGRDISKWPLEDTGVLIEVNQVSLEGNHLKSEEKVLKSEQSRINNQDFSDKIDGHVIEMSIQKSKNEVSKLSEIIINQIPDIIKFSENSLEEINNVQSSDISEINEDSNETADNICNNLDEHELRDLRLIEKSETEGQKFSEVEIADTDDVIPKNETYIDTTDDVRSEQKSNSEVPHPGESTFENFTDKADDKYEVPKLSESNDNTIQWDIFNDVLQNKLCPEIYDFLPQTDVRFETPLENEVNQNLKVTERIDSTGLNVCSTGNGNTSEKNDCKKDLEDITFDIADESRNEESQDERDINLNDVNTTPKTDTILHKLELCEEKTYIELNSDLCLSSRDHMPDLKEKSRDINVDNCLCNNRNDNTVDLNEVILDITKEEKKENNNFEEIISTDNSKHIFLEKKITNNIELDNLNFENSDQEIKKINENSYVSLVPFINKDVIDPNEIIPNVSEAPEGENNLQLFKVNETSRNSMSANSTDNLNSCIDLNGAILIDTSEEETSRTVGNLDYLAQHSNTELMDRSENNVRNETYLAINSSTSKIPEENGVFKSKEPKCISSYDSALVEDYSNGTNEQGNISSKCDENDCDGFNFSAVNQPTRQKESHLLSDKKDIVETSVECNKNNELKENITTDDLKDSQEEVKLSVNVFTSTPANQRIKSYVLSEDRLSGVNLFGVNTEKDDKSPNFYSEVVPLDSSKELNYSLETWDNFLGRTLDAQADGQSENLFEGFSSEPHSLLFIEGGNDLVQAHECAVARNIDGEKQDVVLEENLEDISNVNNATYVVESKHNGTFTIDGSEAINNRTFALSKTDSVESDPEEVVDNSSWGGGAGSGWFLHPQTSNKEPSGTMEVRENTGSYVGFGIDDEIMAAIRTELLNKLPHAQVAPSEKVTEVEEWDSNEKNEVFLKYNIYNPPLSPILEESYIDEGDIVTPKQESDNEDSEWSEPDMPETLPPEPESQSAHTYDSQMKGPHHRHTPSQDSCCSNDTLFNLEELTCLAGDNEKENDAPKSTTVTETEHEPERGADVSLDEKCILDDVVNNQNLIAGNENDVMEKSENSNDDKLIVTSEAVEKQKEDIQAGIENPDMSSVINDQEINVTEFTKTETVNNISEFISREIEHSSKQYDGKQNDRSSSDTTSSVEESPMVFKKIQVAPLPSPEDKPWKQLPASLLSYDKVISQSNAVLLPAPELDNVVPEVKDKEAVESQHKELTDECENKCQELSELQYENSMETGIQPTYENVKTEQADHEDVKDRQPVYENVKDMPSLYENVRDSQPVYENIKDPQPLYQNFDVSSDIYNEIDYVNIVNLENSKNSEKKDLISTDSDQDENKALNENSQDEDIYGMLTDIKFNGPTENQLISTSFSESNDINDEQDWDSGSDTRSSSSGEFIWKEGEHEESLKALRAAPQDVLENVKPMEGIAEESTDESDLSGSSSDEEVPEFVPSAWDKFATPTKSALRSPEKTMEKTEKNKSRGVWFKKQKYHCVYEYPREPESPVLQSQDLWKPQLDYSSFTDWEFDADTYIPPSADDTDILPSPYNYQPKSVSSRNLYQLTSISDFVPSNMGQEDEFFVSSTSRPFDAVGSLSSQFFPGNTNWAGETPDSGVEDSTPGSSTEIECNNVKMTNLNSVDSLKKLASNAAKRSKQMSIKSNDALGGLRHTRNKLKLDLPPSPSAFTSAKMFTMEPSLEPVIREKPTFTTFGKSRFSVQHVDTPPDDSRSKNVSFEALPYKPLKEVLKNDSQEESCYNVDRDDKIFHEKQILQDKFDCVKGHSEFIRGEASLLDSADEDSGIESSTLERKLSNEGLLQ